MNDYWNDPPDYPDPPECCGQEMETNDKTGGVICRICQRSIDPEPEVEPLGLTEDVGIANTCRTCGAVTDCVYCSNACAPACAHGSKGSCDHCDYLSDLAFDAARESA
jgi:hypothetical protein